MRNATISIPISMSYGTQNSRPMITAYKKYDLGNGMDSESYQPT